MLHNGEAKEERDVHVGGSNRVYMEQILLPSSLKFSFRMK